MTYAYLEAVGVLGLLWVALFMLRPAVRRKMLWTSVYATLLLSLGYFILSLLFLHLSPERRIVPGYWDPDTLFDLGRLTGGWSIEDVLYMFTTGGIASVIYDLLVRDAPSAVEGPLWKRRREATLIPAIVTCAVILIPGLRLIWALITFCVAGTAVIWYLRPDLIRRSLVGGILYAALYYVLYAFLFLHFFPDYLATHYALSNLSGIFVGKLPFEEIFFALCFGLMWSPIYEYARDIRAPR